MFSQRWLRISVALIMCGLPPGILACARLDLCGAAVVVGQQASRGFSPAGYYFLVSKQPKRQHGFGDLHVSVQREGGRRGVAVSFTAEGGVPYYTTDAKLEREAFTFKIPENDAGISYGFAGRFLSLTKFVEGPKPVLEGMLTKYRNGQKVEHYTVKYAWTAGHD